MRRNGNQGDPTVTTLDRDEKDGTSVESGGILTVLAA